MISLVILKLVGLYFLPFIVACCRKMPETELSQIFGWNLILGCTVIVWILALRYVLRWEPEKPGDMDWNEWDEKEQERRESGQDMDLGGFWYHPLLDSVDAGSIDDDRIRGPWTPPLLIVGFLGWVIVILGAWAIGTILKLARSRH
jgi:hypothetical protein